MLYRGGRSKWLIYSAWHKSLRLTVGSRSADWLNVLLRFTTPNNLTEYMRKIVCEEMRSIYLLRLLHKKNTDIRELNYEFTRVKKKWSHANLQADHIKNWYNSLLLTQQNIKDGQRPNYLQQSLLSQNYIYQFYWFHKLSKTDDTNFWSYAKTFKTPEVDELYEVRPKGSYARMFCEELLSGIPPLEDRVELLPPRSESRQLVIPPLIPEFYDIHTSAGKRQILTNLDKIKINTHTTPNLCLSGQVLGVLWRLKTAEKYGDIQHPNGTLRTWSNTGLDELDYSQALGLDSYFYPAVYGQSPIK